MMREALEEAIRYGIEIEADYYGNGQDDERYIAEPAAAMAAQWADHSEQAEAATGSDRLRTALAALVAEIDHEAKYGAGLIYAWVHESNMQEARDALVASGQGGEK